MQDTRDIVHSPIEMLFAMLCARSLLPTNDDRGVFEVHKMFKEYSR